MPLWSSLPPAGPLTGPNTLVIDQGGTFGLVTIAQLAAAIGGAQLGAANVFTVGPQLVKTGADANAGIQIRGHSALQSGNLVEFQRYDGFVISFISGSGNFVLKSQVSLVWLDSAGGSTGIVRMDAGDNLDFTSFHATGSVVIGVLNGGGTGTVDFYTANVLTLQVDATNRVIFNPVGATSAGVTPAVVKGSSAQTADLQEWQDNAGTVLCAISAGGGFLPVSLADASAPVNCLYFSTDAGKLVYKDSGGTVNALY